MKRLTYEGSLVRGRNSDDPDTPRYWHIADNPTAAGDFLACGVAMEELEMVADERGEQTETKEGGICTCEDCIEQVLGWQAIVNKCPALRKGNNAEEICVQETGAD